MLKGLDDIPWAELEHAYGSAADVPDLLRKLLDPDPKVRNEVFKVSRPVSTLVQVSALIKEDCCVEIEVVAARVNS